MVSKPKLRYTEKMSETKQRPNIDEITGNTDETPEPGHDAWFRKQVQETLEKKKKGELTYRDLDEVAKDFGFNAR